MKKTNKIYKEQLNKLVERMNSVKNTSYTSYIKVVDLDVVNSDPYGQEKFGCGDLRILCQLVKK